MATGATASGTAATGLETAAARPESFFRPWCLCVVVFLSSLVSFLSSLASFLSSLVSVPVSFFSSLSVLPLLSWLRSRAKRARSAVFRHLGWKMLPGRKRRCRLAVRGGTAGIGIGNGDRAPGTTHQQARCEHANTCSEAQMRQTHHLAPTSQRTARQSPTFATLSHGPTIASTGIANQIRSLNGQQQPFLRRLDVQSARSGSANDACAQRRRPGRSQSVNDSQKLGGLAVRPRRQQLCTSTGRLGSEDCEATSHIGCPAR